MPTRYSPGYINIPAFGSKQWSDESAEFVLSEVSGRKAPLMGLAVRWLQSVLRGDTEFLSGLRLSGASFAAGAQCDHPSEIPRCLAMNAGLRVWVSAAP